MLGLAMVTVTPGRTAPVASETLPLIDPLVALTCAKAGAAATATSKPKTTATILFIAPPNQAVKCKTKIPTPTRGTPYGRAGGPVDAHFRTLCRMPEG